jgi:hypothetical protein
LLEPVVFLLRFFLSEIHSFLTLQSQVTWEKYISLAPIVPLWSTGCDAISKRYLRVEKFIAPEIGTIYSTTQNPKAAAAQRPENITRNLNEFIHHFVQA